MSPQNGISKWQQAGIELLRGNIGNAIKSVTGQVLDPLAYRNGMYFFGEGEPSKFFEYDTLEKAADAYRRCPEFQSIINRRATAHIAGKRWIMNSRGKEAIGPFADKCRKLLNRPNHFQSGRTFEAQLKIFVDVFGWCLILPVYASDSLAKYGLSEASSMYLIPPFMLSWRETGKWRYAGKLGDAIQEIVLVAGGERTYLNLEQVIIIRDTTPRMCDGIDGGMGTSIVFPDTKVRANQAPINNIIGAYESRGELISFAGSQGIVSPNPGSGQYTPIGLLPDEEKELQEKFTRQYGIRKKQYRYIISPQAIQFQLMGRPTKDLMLFEEVEADIKAICNAWPYPWKLLADSGSSLNGTEVDALTRNLYQDSIIPEADSFNQQWAEAFKAAENNVKFESDYSELPALQENALEQANKRKINGEAVNADFKNGFIKYNRALELLGEDTIGPEGEIYYFEWIKTHSTNGNDQGQEQPAATATAAA